MLKKKNTAILFIGSNSLNGVNKPTAAESEGRWPSVKDKQPAVALTLSQPEIEDKLQGRAFDLE